MTNSERIEAYFDEQLSSTEKESLLRDIEADQSLKAEFEFQKQVIEGIQTYRKQELISKLNTIKVGSAGSSTLTKILGAIGIAAVMTGGLYWYFGSDEEIKSVESEIEIASEEPKVPSMTEDTPVAENIDEVAPEKAETSNEIVETESGKAVETAPQEESVNPEINVPEMAEPDSENIAAVEDNHDAPESLKSETVAVSSSADVEIKLDKKYDFHYQVINGDLTLYGDFNDSKFEVIELKTNKGIKLYLFYNERYFELSSDSKDIKPLVPVENKSIINELDRRRK